MGGCDGKEGRNYPLEVHLSTQLVEIAKLPVEQQPPAVKKLKSGIPDLSLLDPFTFKWWIERLFEPFFYAQARLRIGVVGIAVERYRLSRGKWPETPGDVAGTSLLQEVPIDPYSGQPLRYERLKIGRAHV